MPDGGIPWKEYLEEQFDHAQADRTEIKRRLLKIEESVDGLKLSRAELAGKASQTSVIAAYLLAFASLLVAIANIAMRG